MSTMLIVLVLLLLVGGGGRFLLWRTSRRGRNRWTAATDSILYLFFGNRV